MPDELTSPSFAIDCPTTAITLDGKGRGTCILTITNTSAAARDGRVRVAGAGMAPASVDWLSIAEPAEQRYQANESRRYTVAIAVPDNQQNGTFYFRAQAYAVANPNEDFVSGPDIGFTVARVVAMPVHSHRWILIVAIVCILIAVGVVVIIVASRSEPEAAPTAEGPPGPGDEGKEPPAKTPPEQGGRPPIVAPGPRRFVPVTAVEAEKEKAVPAAAASGTIVLHQGAKADLEAARECTPAEQAGADLALAGTTLGAAELEPVNGAHLAKVATATLEASEAAVSHAPLTSIQVEAMKPGELFACRTHQGLYVVIELVHAVNGKPFSVELHYQHVSASRTFPVRKP